MMEFFYFVSLARRTFLLAGVLIASCCALSGQPDGPMGPPPDGPPPGGMQDSSQFRGPSVERQLKRLTQLLTLSEAQQAQVKVILTDQRQQIEALVHPSKASESGGASSATSDKTASNDDQPPSREAMEALRASVKSIRETTRAKIAAVLNDSQKATYATFEAKREKAMAQQESDDMPPPPDGGGPPPDGGGPGGGGPPGGGPPGI